MMLRDSVLIKAQPQIVYSVLIQCSIGYVAVATYENLLLVNRKTRKHPVFIGPKLVHQKCTLRLTFILLCTFETYLYFASEV